MKKLLSIIVLGLLWANTSFANDHKPNNFDAFVWSDGKKLKIQKGRDIENPENNTYWACLLYTSPSPRD